MGIKPLVAGEQAARLGNEATDMSGPGVRLRGAKAKR
jgi:hypothetical protein